ncbi:class I SAM-dependent rRNA methyltransferase [Tumebacillus permanentifrigoris]|uniref:23S rRNA (Cytosine1962-C5)-methyltransferase n=1 Tax=Tumebacillus permanentifrigoris TaxID=378543 RepID=A0A316D5B9_9BACL|nr:class I SAM-dependent rRNA methyltransferase [Tumebacillus permanentifrigoris]PWK08400.1 23S rRNA (cytosine1962-C5)-methyltransferase [Tumebacillus permanentifrigoris]
MALIKLKKTRNMRLEAGNPWVFNNEIERLEGKANPGDIVEIQDYRGLFLARGYYNPKSQISVRVMTYTQGEEIDQAFFTRKVRECYHYRSRFVDSDSFRLIYGEADFLPGLVVDKFGDVLVVQILSLGMEVRKDLILNALKEVLNPKAIYERSDVSVRKLEGLEQRTGLLYGELDGDVVIEENGLKMLVDVVGGQKTGYFFDQRENRAAIRDLVKQNVEGEPGSSVLECFSHTGSFTVHAAAFGARNITTLDISEHAIDTAIKNVELNGFEDKADFEFVVADAFEQLREWEREKRQWDVVILDPPAFAKNKNAVTGALRGYKEINLRGMKLVKERGFLVTASCSYHIDPDLFLETISEAAFDAKKVLRLVEYRSAGKDHPKLHGMDENNYLKFAIFEVRSRR